MEKTRRKCAFTESLEKEFPSFKRTEKKNVVFCKICCKTINIENKGKYDLLQHTKSKLHKENVKAIGLSSVAVLQKSVLQPSSSVDCTNKLNAAIFSDSATAQAIRSCRTKTEAIVNGVLAPQALSDIKKLLKDRIKFIGISTDGSNHGATKLFPIMIQYFDVENDGICHKLIDFKSVPNEKSETICNLILNSLSEFELSEKCIAFCGDNCNTNFGAVGRAGNQNVFSMLKKYLQCGENLNGIGCPAHILSNCIQYGIDFWPIDVESILYKIYKHFSIYTVRTESLKSFCDFVEVDFKQILSYSKTRWLSLFPVIERVLKMFEPLKSYFLNLSDPPVLIKKFFENSLSEAYLLFLHSLAFVFNSSIQQMEKQNNSLLEILAILKNIRCVLETRHQNKFIPLSVKSIIAHLNISNDESGKFKNVAFEIYSNAIKYLDKWSNQFKNFEAFSWMALQNNPEWSDVSLCLEILMEKDILIDDVKCIDQFQALKSFLCKAVENEDFAEKLSHEKWMQFFKTSEYEQYSEFLKICQYLYAIPPHNANLERIFSLMNAQWTDERNKLSVESMKNILILQFNFKDVDCLEYYNSISTHEDLLKQVRSQEKYDFK